MHQFFIHTFVAGVNGVDPSATFLRLQAASASVFFIHRAWCFTLLVKLLRARGQTAFCRYTPRFELARCMLTRLTHVEDLNDKLAWPHTLS